MKIKGLIFDLDGVLVNTEHNHFVAWKRTADSLGIPFSEAENESLKGVSRVDSLIKILALGGMHLEPEKFNELLLNKNAFYLESIKDLSEANLLPGVIELLEKASQMGIKLGVGSSSKNAKYILARLKITDYFDCIIDGNDVRYPKPHPEVFLNGSKQLDLDPAECIVFEDAASGIAAAKEGGFYAIAVGNKLIAEQADQYYDDLTQFRLEDYAELIRD